jgi:hypothetical protein
MRWQAIEDQMQWLAAPPHHPAQQIDEQRRSQGAGIGGKPERAFGIDRRRGTDPLALTWLVRSRGIGYAFADML